MEINLIHIIKVWTKGRHYNSIISLNIIKKVLYPAFWLLMLSSDMLSVVILIAIMFNAIALNYLISRILLMILLQERKYVDLTFKVSDP